MSVQTDKPTLFRAAAASFAGAVLLAALLSALTPRFDKPLSFAIYDRGGKLLGASVSADGQWRFAAGAVPPRVSSALVAFEDRRFYLHPGIDPFPLARALRQNVSSGRIVSGGSTLTMQTVRISQDNRRRTLGRKIGEAFLAVALELRYTKKEILSLYAANAPFGGNVVGIEAASWRYFNRPGGDLTWAEAATLAVLPNQPSLVHPGADRERLLEKRNRLLGTLYRDGLFGTGEAGANLLRLSLAEPLPDKPWPLPRLAPHYLERLKAGMSIAGGAAQAAVTTTIDRKLQGSVVSILERWSARFSGNGINNACALVIDTGTGEILAYAGNTGAGREKKYNADVDMVTARRSSGSLLKPFLFAGMLDAGLLLPTQLVVDIPTRIGSYKPENNLPVYQGVIPAGEALSRSLNIPAIRELRDYGIAPFLDLLSGSGFTTFDRSADEYGLPLILGGGEITLDETVRAYAALMNRATGTAAENPANGTAVSGVPATEAVSTGAAWLTLEALLNGTRPNDEALWQSFASARKIAWKTGTSYGNRDAWAIGVTPRYTVGIWVGNASGEGRSELKSITTAAPVLFDIFGILGQTDWPPRPEAELREITVCADSGFAAGPDCEQTMQAWKPRGAPAGNPCPYCRSVSLTSDGKFQATANDLTGQRQSELPLVRRQFVLPPAIEYWYMRQNLSYRKLPPWIAGHSGDTGKNEMSIVFPESGARVYIPVELDGTPGLLILEAAHRNRDETVYWDIDGEFLGETRNYHQIAVRPDPGKHILTVTDTRGSRQVRAFEILGE